MSKIRMNTEYRNKFYNRIKDVFEKEETQEQQAFFQSREDFNEKQKSAFEVARQIVERSYPKEDVATLRTFKKKYGDPCDVVAKDKCFYFAYTDGKDDDGDYKETKSHFDFGLYGNLNGNEYSSDDSEHFAHAYFREELKANGCNPDIIAQQSGKDSNPHKTKHVDANNKYLGKNTYSNDSGTGMTRNYNDQFHLDVIGTSHCRSRAIPCTIEEYAILLTWRQAKAKVVSTHQTWVDSISKQCEQLKIGLKAYRYMSEGIELAKQLGIELDEAELVRTNSTGLTIYNPENLANLIKGMKNKTQTREQKIALRKQYESVN
tara:strand:+ start:1557 stop:2513 length:957 start_codon:yes stop_codon:yes gene_type:complete